jgi:catechol 2,3-dioxygenase-like lactoylglutathione lyase family enzyme
MLAAKEAMATVAVKDLGTAKKFYADTLGLKEVAKQGEEAITYQSGNSKLLVYRSQFAGTNKATEVHWVVGNEIDSIVQTLKGKGVKFEHYDMPQLKRDGDIYGADGFKTAWFKDPDGNILSLVTG